MVCQLLPNFVLMILLTGATGLLGSRLLFDLVSKGYKVRAMRRDKSTMNGVDHYFSDNTQLMENVEWFTGDVTDIFSLEAAMENVDSVYHCAARVSFLPADRDAMTHTNVQGTANVVNLCLEKGVRKLCHTSSVAALGRTGADKFIDETNAWKTSKYNSSYAVSKYGAEQEVWRGVAEGLNAVIVNPGIIIGSGNWETDSSSIFNRVNKGLMFYTEGVGGFVDVRDVARAMIRLMESEISNERFILVSQNLPFKTVFDQIADAFDKKRASIYAGPLLTALAWRSEAIKAWFSGQKPVITRETARSAKGKNLYENSKILKFLDFQFIPVEKAIKDTAEKFLREYKN